jgi:hypothetical protein
LRGSDKGLAAHRAVKHQHALWRQTAQQVHRRGVGNGVDGEGNGRAAGFGCNPLGEIRSIDQHDVAADRLNLGDNILTPNHIDGLQAKRLRDRDQRPADARVGAVVNDPGPRWQCDVFGQQQIGGRGIDAEHGKLMDVAASKRPQPARVRLDPFRPCGGRIGHERPVAFFQMPDAATDRDDAADAFRSHDAG